MCVLLLHSYKKKGNDTCIAGDCMVRWFFYSLAY